MAEQPTNHKHEWVCYEGEADMLICKAAHCETMARISTLLKNVEARGRLQGSYDTFLGFMENHWLTRTGRKYVQQALVLHPITRERDLRAGRQGRLTV